MTREDLYDEDILSEELEPEEPEDWLDSAVRATPWWAISVGAHFVLIIIMTVMIISAEVISPPDVVVVGLTPEPEKDELIIEKTELFTNEKILPSEVASEDPVFIKNAIEADHNETEDEEDTEKAKGDSMDFLSDTDFKAKGITGTIGIGGGASGAYGGRFGGRKNAVAKGGGGPITENAVTAGLRWLSRHQNPDGSWSAEAYNGLCGTVNPQKYSGTCEGVGMKDYDTGVTGLSLLAFLGAGYTHMSKDTYDGICFGDVIRKAIQWLQSQQDGEGFIGRNGVSKFMYNHTVCALALAEAYGLTGSPLFKDSAQRAINAVLNAQNPYKAWRYTIKPGDNDTSVTGWAVMALKSAEISGLSVGRQGFEGASAFLEEVTETTYYRVGYTSRETAGRRIVEKGLNEHFDHHEALTAVGMMCRIFIDKNRKDPALRGGAELLTQDLPSWNGNAIDFYYWYYASLALFQYDGPRGQYWRAWNEQMKDALVTNQKFQADGCRNGSWDSVGRWCHNGGRVYATAINVLTLEVYYRYDNVFGVR